jgi:hypothetical protein
VGRQGTKRRRDMIDRKQERKAKFDRKKKFKQNKKQKQTEFEYQKQVKEFNKC